MHVKHMYKARIKHVKERRLPTACQAEMKSISKTHVSETIRRKHVYNKMEMKTEPSVHVAANVELFVKKENCNRVHICNPREFHLATCHFTSDGGQPLMMASESTAARFEPMT